MAVGLLFSLYNLMIFFGVDLPAFWEMQSALQVLVGTGISACVYVIVSLATKPENSLRAILEGLELLKKDGVMSLCIYSGGDTGFEERDSILEMLKILDSRKYVVILSTYYNRENNPPIPVLVIKK